MKVKIKLFIIVCLAALLTYGMCNIPIGQKAEQAIKVFFSKTTHDKVLEEKMQYAIEQWMMAVNDQLSYEQAKNIVRTVNEYSVARNIDPLFIYGIMYAETRFRHKAHNTYGATGLMQVVPRWHHDKLKGRNPFDIKVNIEVGTKVLVDCDRKYRSSSIEKALHCYNGGASNKYNERVLVAQKAIITRLNAIRISHGLPTHDKHDFNSVRITKNSFPILDNTAM